MTKESRIAFGPGAIFIVLAGLLCTAELTILSLPQYRANPGVLAPAITLDLALGLPALGYFFLVRTRRAGWLVLVPLCLSGLLLARWWIPPAHLNSSGVLELLAVILEGSLLVALAWKFRRIRATYRTQRKRHPYRLDALRVAMRRNMGRRAGGAILGEVTVLWYALAGWRRPREDHPAGPVFPCYRRGGYVAVFSAVVIAVIVETGVLHLLLSLWIGSWAWLVTALGIYSVLWLMGDLHAARHNPTILTDSGLHLRTGLRWSADLTWSDVVAIREEPPPEKGVKLVLWGTPDFWIECQQPALVAGLMGIERRSRFLGVGIDDPSGFREEVEARIG